MDLSKIKVGDTLNVKLDRFDAENKFHFRRKSGDIIQVTVIVINSTNYEWFAVKCNETGTIFEVASKQILPIGKLTKVLYG